MLVQIEDINSISRNFKFDHFIFLYIEFLANLR